MVLTCDVTAATASGDTTETQIGQIQLPPNAQRILGIGIGSPSGVTMTTLEDMTGFFRVLINSLDVSPAKFPFQGPSIVGTGGTYCPFFIWPVDWDRISNALVTIYVTMDMAQTANPTYRGFVFYEKS